MTLVSRNDQEEKELFKGFTAKFVHSEKMTIAFVNVEKESSLPEHSHVHEQVLNVIEGKFELIIDGEVIRIEKGESYVIPSNKPHAGRSVTDCYIIDVFHPVREDFKKL
ncbi:MAG: cupin domain-containing protein [Candidatus Kariarchaeaceae archaeon]|jgi:quercetin dioxygenase-like cupin family protein